MKSLVILAALIIAAGARADWIDRVQPACAELRGYSAMNLERVARQEDEAKDEKDPAKRKRLEASAKKNRKAADAQRRQYEKCRKSAPKVMSEEQARREEQQAAEADLRRMLERRNHPPGAIAPRPRQ